MDFTAIVRRRRMVRRFQPGRAVPSTVRDQLLDVARRAPSAGFSQGVSFLLMETEADRERFWSVTAPAGPADRWLTGLRSAPLLITLWCSERAYRRRYAEPDKAGPTPISTETPTSNPARPDWAAPFWYVDAGMAAMALLYAVVDAGAGAAGSAADDDRFGACFFGLPADRVDAVRSEFGVPAEQLPVGAVAVGYRHPDERPSGSPTRRGRKPVDELVHHGSWSA